MKIMKDAVKRLEKEFETVKREAVEHEKKLGIAIARMNKISAQVEILEKLLNNK